MTEPKSQRARLAAKLRQQLQFVGDPATHLTTVLEDESISDRHRAENHLSRQRPKHLAREASGARRHENALVVTRAR